MSEGGENGRPPRDAGRPGWLTWLRAIARGRGEQSFRESIEGLIDEHEHDPDAGASDGAEREMLRNLLEFGELEADDIMVPRTDIEAVPVTITLDELVRTFVECDHSRLVVIRETLDDVVGMIHIKDVLQYWNRREAFDMEKMVRAVLFVPPSLPLSVILERMQNQRIHLALVVDEYGGTDGLITIENLIEEIVGDIEDEHDEQEEPMLLVRADGTLEADGRAPVEEIEEALGVELLPEDFEEEVDTLGGLVAAVAGHVPARGETVEHPSGASFEVLDADPRHVKRVLVHRPPPPPPAAERE